MNIRGFRVSLSRLKLLPLFLAGALLNPARAQQTLTWDANTGSSGAQDGAGTWDTAANNWWNGSANVLFASGDNVSFGAANANAAHTVTLGASLSAGNVNFGGGNALPRYTVDLGGNTLTVGGQLNLYAQANDYYSAFSNGTLSLARVGSSQGSPDIFFDPNDGGDYGAFLTATVNVGTGSRYIRGAPQRNDFDRYFGDLRFDGPLTGSADVYFSGTTNDSGHNMHFGLNAANSGFTGGVTLNDHTDLALLDIAALSSANNLTFNTTTGRSTLFLYGHNVTIGNLSDTSSGGSRFIRNGSLTTTNGGTNSADHGQDANSIITITQTTDGSFSGVVADGPNDNATGAVGTYRTLGLTKAGAATLTLNGVNTYTGPTTVNAGTLQIGGAGQLNSGAYAGAISLTGALNYASSAIQTLSGNITGGGSLTHSGSATLTLTGANSFSGATAVNAGTLLVNGAGTLAGTSGITINSGATLEFGGNTNRDSLGSNSKPITVNTGGTLKVSANNAMGYTNLNNLANVNLAGGTLTANALAYVGTLSLGTGSVVNGTGAIQFWYAVPTAITATADATISSGIILNNSFAATTSVSSGASLTVSGGITGTNGSINKTGAGTLLLTGVNTYTGSTTVSAGTLQIGGAGQLNSGAYAAAISLTGVLNYASSANQTLSGDITGGGSLTHSGGGTLTLSGASNAYTGGTTWSGGNLTIVNGTNLGTGPLAVTKTSAGTLRAANTAAITVANNISLPAPGSATTYSLIKNSAGIALGTELNLTGNITGGNANTTLLLDSNTQSDNTTSFRFAGSNTFRATINLNRGAISVGSATGLGDTANLVYLNSNPNATDGNLRFENAMTLANPVQIAWDGMAVNTGANTVTFSGVFSGTEDVTKLGTGTLNLTNSANTHSGAVTISAGTFQLSGGGRLNNGTHAGAIVNNGALAIGTTATQSLNGAMSGAGSFTKSNSGILNLGNNGSTFSGGISITGGQVRATGTSSVSNGALGTGPITIANGTALHFFVPSGTNNTFANNIQLPTTGSQQFIISAPSSTTTVRLTGQLTGGGAGQTFRLADSNVSGNHNNVLILDNPANSFTGTIEMWRGTLGFTSDAALGNLGNDIRHYTENNTGSLLFDADNIVLNSGRNIQFYGSNAPFPFNTQGYTGTINGVISNTGNLVKQGSGTLVLNGVNTYNGSNSIAAGTLRVTDVADAGLPSGLGASATQPLATISPGATLEYAGTGADASNRGLVLTGSGNATVSVSEATGTLTMNGALSGSANFVKSGAGRLVVAGSESWNADGFVIGGTLTIGGVASPGTNSLDGGNWTVTGGTFHVNTSGSVTSSTITATTGTVHLESGTLRFNTLNASGGTVLWGAGTLGSLTPSNLGGDGVDVSGPGGSVVYTGYLPGSGKQLYVDGNLSTSAGSTLDLGDVYLSAGVIYNQLWVTGSLSIAEGTTLAALASPQLLRPSNGGTPFDYGSMVLVHAEGGISYASPTALSFIAPGSDGRSFDEYTGIWPASGNPQALPDNSWYLELGANEIILHYRVAAAIPEPSSVSMLIGGTLLLRVVRRRNT